MSGANSQPWEYIVVKDAKVKKDLFRCYSEDNTDFIYWMEQQRVFELRHPAYQMTADEAVDRQRRGRRLAEAPALIVVVATPAASGHGAGAPLPSPRSFASDNGLANTCTFMHLAGWSLGLADPVGDDSRSGTVQESARVPDLMMPLFDYSIATRRCNRRRCAPPLRRDRPSRSLRSRTSS